MLKRIDWEPYKFQSEAVEWALRRYSEGFLWTPLFIETGCGKSPISYEIIMHWYSIGLRKFLIVAPMNVVGNHLDEFEKFKVPLRIVKFKPNATKESKQRVINGIEWNNDIRAMVGKPWDVLVVNYESLRIVKEDLIAAGFGGIVFDEAHKLKNMGAAWTKAAREVTLSIKARRGGRLGLTGTPVTKSPLDLWSIFDVLDPYPENTYSKHHQLGYGSYRSFEQQICTKTAHPRLKGVYKYFFPEVCLKQLQSRVAYHAFEAFKEDVLPWLPEQRFQKMYVDMTEEQSKLYNLLREESVAVLKGEAFDRGKLDAQNIQPLQEWLKDRENIEEAGIDETEIETNVAPSGVIAVNVQTVLLMRLHQVACGHVKLNDKRERLFGGGKVDYLRDELPKWVDVEENNKVIIFTAFRADVKILTKLCDELKLKYVALVGGKGAYAQEYVREFQNESKTRVFICNLAAGSSGITLTAANRVCYYSVTYNWEHRRQSMDRAHRIGQERPVLYTDLMCRDSMEKYVLENLLQKKRLARMTTRKFSAILEGAT